jgi:hypothetical protein
MKKRTIFTIIGVILLLFVLKNVLSGQKAPVVAPVTTREAKIVKTQIVTKSSFSEQVHVTGRVGADRETIVSTQ